MKSPLEHLLNVCSGALLWLFSAVGLLNAGEWPQILGPTRDGKAVDEKLAAEWPADGPPVVWQRSVGHGYAGLAVAGGRALLFHRLGEEVLIESLEAGTGAPQWKKAFPTRYQSSIAPDDGPRCVPLVHQGRVYLFTAEGELHCLRLDSGEIVWSRAIDRELNAPLGYFGAGSTPIVIGDRLLVNVGAPKAGIVALALADGKTLWQATDEAASYSSPIAAKVAGHEWAIFVTRLSVLSIDPQNGAVQFRIPFGARGPTVNAATPLLLGDRLFVSASYGVGAKFIQLDGGQPRVLWADDSVMSSQYTTSIEHDGALFGIDGRQDQGPARLRAFDPATRKIYWTQEGFGTGTLILADGKLLAMKTDGELILAEPSTEVFRPLARAKIFDDVVQPLPALAGGLLYVRDHRTLKCLDLGLRQGKR